MSNATIAWELLPWSSQDAFEEALEAAYTDFCDLRGADLSPGDEPAWEDWLDSFMEALVGVGGLLDGYEGEVFDALDDLTLKLMAGWEADYHTRIAEIRQESGWDDQQPACDFCGSTSDLVPADVFVDRAPVLLCRPCCTELYPEAVPIVDPSHESHWSDTGL